MPRVTPKHLTLLRVGCSLGGFAAALLAVSLGERRFTWAAIALLAASLIIRLVQRRPKSD
jgi:hypothetical protein